MMEENLRYEDSGINPKILRAVSEMGYTQMTPIQEQAIPQLMEGKDVIGQAQTGTGKTAAFGIPMLQMVDPASRELQGMILCPTRELAIQAAEELHKFSKYMHGIRVVPIYGGQDISRQIKALKGGVQIIVGTPGRVMDHMRRHTIKLDSLKMVVLDEADEMLNMGFREDMEAILGEIPGEHQTALFSATMPQAILDITYKYQKDAVVVRITKQELTIPLVKQYYYVVKNIYKEEAISRLIDTYNLKRSIVFCNTKKMVDELAEHLKDRGYQAEGLHGDMTQKQRDFVMNRFKNGSLQVLIATDVAARGIDVDDLEAVFNYDVPQDTEYYVHRIGRTGRAGREGLAFTFAYGRDLYRIREIERVCKTKMTEQKLPKSAQVMDIKLNKLLQAAKDTLDKEDYVKLQDQIEEKMEDYELDPMELLAYLVRKEIGEAPEEIVIEEPRKRRSSFDDRRKRFSDDDRRKRFSDDDRRKRFADDGGHKSRAFGRGDKEVSRRGGSYGDRERSSRRDGSHSDRERYGRSDRDSARGERKGSDRSRERSSRRDGSRGERKENRK
mgnify:CR=1 FL=1